MRKEGRLIGIMRRTHLQSRLLAVCLLLSLIPVLVVGLYAYQIYTSSINRNLGQSAEQAVRLLNATVASELGKFSAYINIISVSEKVQEILLRPEDERILPNGSVALAIKEYVQEVPAQSRYLKNIRVVDRAGNVLYDLGFDDISHDQFTKLLSGLDAASPEDSLQYVKTYRGVNALVLGRKIYQFARPRVHIGYILIYINETLFSQNIFADINFGQGSNIMLMDGKGQILSSRDETYLGRRFDEEDGLHKKIEQAEKAGRGTLNAKIEDQNHLVVFDYNPDIDTYFIAAIPETVITAETRRITGSLAFVASVTVLLSLGLAMVIYRSIVTPIRRIVQFCDEATANKTERHVVDESRDELGYLTRAIDRFVHEIQRLLHKSKQDERRKRKLELEMLQYQINPHFLFNTLNTLKWIAVLNDVPVLSEGITSLSQLLQSTLLRTEESIPIREELDNLRHYVSIQKIRYADRFQMAWEADERLLDTLVPRFILQPLVENAILHGAKEGGADILITIGCYQEQNGDVQLFVKDNGQGFEAVDVQKKSREGFSGIGVSNVHERIRLSFGEPYGLQIQSVLGEGTLCRITLPGTFTSKEEGANAESTVSG